MRSADNNWDFWTLLPEALHQVTTVMSERGIPKSFRHMHGFSSHACSFINAAKYQFCDNGAEFTCRIGNRYGRSSR
jgi:catalase